MVATRCRTGGSKVSVPLPRLGCMHVRPPGTVRRLLLHSLCGGGKAIVTLWRLACMHKRPPGTVPKRWLFLAVRGGEKVVVTLPRLSLAGLRDAVVRVLATAVHRW